MKITTFAYASLLFICGFWCAIACTILITNKTNKESTPSANYVEKIESKTDTNGHMYAVEWRHSKGCKCLN